MIRYKFENNGTVANDGRNYLCNDGKVRDVGLSTSLTVGLFYFKNKEETQKAIDKYNKSFNPAIEKIKERLVKLKRDIANVEDLLDRI